MNLPLKALSLGMRSTVFQNEKAVYVFLLLENSNLTVSVFNKQAVLSEKYFKNH